MQVPKETFDKYFSCFSQHLLEFNGVEYKTAEHAYHSQRYSDEAILAEIREAPTARDAWVVSQKYKDQQKSDFSLNKRSVMKEILLAKVAQHADVKGALLQTDGAEIAKEEPKDAYWGTGLDGQGRNELGKLWMEVRNEIQV